MSVEIYRRLLEILARGETAALVTVVEATGSVPGKPGFKMVVDSRGCAAGTVGGGSLENTAIGEAQRALGEGSSRLFRFSLTPEEAGGLGMLCGGEAALFIEVVSSADELFIVGAGHIAQPLAAMGKMLGFTVTVTDDREEFCTRERFPEADRLLAGELPAVIGKMNLHRKSYVVIVTRGHAGDQLALELTLRSKAGYLGMIGSRRKVEAVFTQLRARGFRPEELARVHAPIGLDIGARTPAEIALSICAEIIAVKNNPAFPGSEGAGDQEQR